jgi:hypothetical protein
MDNNLQPIKPNANLNFYYLNLSVQPSNKEFKLSDFHPSKKLLFYIENLTHPPGKKAE